MGMPSSYDFCYNTPAGDLLNLPGPYNAITDVSKSIVLPTTIRIMASITTGSNPRGDGILILGKGGQCDGQLYVWIGGSATVGRSISECSVTGSRPAVHCRAPQSHNPTQTTMLCACMMAQLRGYT